MEKINDIPLADLYTVLHIDDSSICYILDSSDRIYYSDFLSIPNYFNARVASIRFDCFGDLEVYFFYV